MVRVQEIPDYLALSKTNDGSTFFFLVRKDKIDIAMKTVTLKANSVEDWVNKNPYENRKLVANSLQKKLKKLGLKIVKPEINKEWFGLTPEKKKS